MQHGIKTSEKSGEQGKRFLCIHGHFYQPPRENPWIEAIEVEDSAAPYHDWNQRICAECYAPNAHARIVQEAGEVQRMINNYEWISFNMGPTLLAWMERHEPRVLEAILEGDERLRLTNYGEFLSLVPPVGEVEIVENSSWSCVHGVERWRSDCGCRPSGSSAHQRWRGPLREALNHLKMKLDRLFEKEGGPLFRDPWAISISGCSRIFGGRPIGCRISSGTSSETSSKTPSGSG